MVSIDPFSREGLAIARKMDVELNDVFHGSIVPIIALDGSQIERKGKLHIVHGPVAMSFGTGTLFRCGDLSFLVTASHVVNEAEQRKLDLEIPARDDPSAHIPLLGQYLDTPAPYDIAICKLSEETIAKLSGYTFQQIEQVNLRDEISPGWFYVHGYPSELTGISSDMTKLFLEPFSYRTCLYDGPTNTFDGYDPSWHVLVSISRDHSSHSDDETDAIIPKSLGGISGSSIWQGYAADYQFADKWTSDDASLVAVQTGVYYRQGDVVVRGTRWSGVVANLLAFYPTLRPTLVPHLPASLSEWFAKWLENKAAE